MLRLNVCCLKGTGVSATYIFVVFTHQTCILAERFIALWSKVKHPKNPRTSWVSAWTHENKQLCKPKYDEILGISYWFTFWAAFHGEKTFKRTVLIFNFALTILIFMNLEIFKKDMPTLCGGFPHQLPTLPYETPDMCFNQGETNPRRKALELFFRTNGCCTAYLNRSCSWAFLKSLGVGARV